MGKPTIGVVNSGLGTFASVKNMLEHLGFDAEIVNDPDCATKFSHLVLPGVGNFSKGVERLDNSGWRGSLIAHVKSGKPLLGICLGMQLLGKGSEESAGNGLGFLDMNTVKLTAGPEYKVPNMGWRKVSFIDNHPLSEGTSVESRFYFVHSFAVPASSLLTIATSSHTTDFASIVELDNVTGFQFHPEKSLKHGFKILENWITSSGRSN